MEKFEQGPTGKKTRELLHGEFSSEEVKKLAKMGYTIADFAFLKKARIIRDLSDLKVLSKNPDFPKTMENLRHMPLEKALEFMEKQKQEKKENQGQKEIKEREE